MEQKGSFTVEAALIMPILLCVIFNVLSLCFFVHDRTWYTAAAYEVATSHSTHKTRQMGQGEEIAQPLLEVNATKKEVQVSYKGKTNWIWGKGSWSFQGIGKVKIIKPAVFIRKARGIENVVENIQKK